MAEKRLRFAQRRKAVGYSQEELADRLGVERSTVGRWERVETEPQPWLRPKLAALLKVTLAELDELLSDVVEVSDKRGGLVLHSSVPLDFAPSPTRTARVMQGFSAHDISGRRQFLGQVSMLGGTALLQPIRQWAASLPVTPLSSSHVGLEDVAELERAVKLFRRWDSSGTGGLRRKAVVGQLNAVAECLEEHHPSAVKRKLFQVTAELAQLAGWMSYDQGFPGLAQRYYLLALHACREGAAPDLGAKIIGDMTQLSTARGHYDDSLELVHTALYSLPRANTVLVRSELLGLEARAYAQLGFGEAANAVRSAESCVEVWHEAPHEGAPDWVHYMKRAEVDCLAANAFIELALREDDQSRWRRHAQRAEAYTLHACDSRMGDYPRSRILDEIRLAKVRLAQREPAESAAVGIRALDLAERARSSLVEDWLIGFDRELMKRYPDPTDVIDFHRQLRNYLRKAAPKREAEIT